MCDAIFKDKHLYSADDFYFCKKHLEVYSNSSWLDLITVEATNDDPNNALLIQDKKDELKAMGINSFITTSYKDEGGSIKSVFTLMVPTSQYNEAKEVFKK